MAALRESRCLNPHPEQVTDEAFLAGEFFDARDAVQVKYEMMRRVSVDGAPVTATAAAFGYSRPSYYQAAAALAASGLEEGPGQIGGRHSDAPVVVAAQRVQRAGGDRHEPGFAELRLADRQNTRGEVHVGQGEVQRFGDPQAGGGQQQDERVQGGRRIGQGCRLAQSRRASAPESRARTSCRV